MGSTTASKKNFRKRKPSFDEGEDEEEESRLAALEEVMMLQRQRDRRTRLPGTAGVVGASTTTTASVMVVVGGGGDDSKEELVLHDTFAQETSEANDDSLMSQYVEQELARRRKGRRGEKNHPHHPQERAEEDQHHPLPVDNLLYITPPHLTLNKRYSTNTHTQWTTGIAEVQLPIEYKLKNIEETEAAKKLLQERRLTGRTKSELNIPSSYSADYFHRGRDYAEKLRREHPELYKDRGCLGDALGSKSTSATDTEITERRQAASDEFMLERFRKREKFRVTRR